jgi:hypothetical protein
MSDTGSGQKGNMDVKNGGISATLDRPHRYAVGDVVSGGESVTSGEIKALTLTIRRRDGRAFPTYRIEFPGYEPISIGEEQLDRAYHVWFLHPIPQGANTGGGSNE